MEKTARLSREELNDGWAEVSRVPRILASVKMGAKTDLGRVRDNNEDKFDFFEPEDPTTLAVKGSFYAVADGMGGHSAGQIACELALKTVLSVYYGDPSPEKEASLRHAVGEANGLIYDTAQTIPDRQGMGTTLTAAVLCEDQLILAQVGDSRAYLLRGGAITQMTDDHSWVAEQVRLGTMTLAEAQVSPFRNIITRSVGTAASVEVDIFAQELQVGDTIVLCSDGLSGHLEPDEIQEIVQQQNPSEAALSLIEAANNRGGRDNITALVLSIRDLLPYAAGEASPGAALSPSAGSKEEKSSRWGRRK
ncbi:MAG: Stp1/IreP family PP2C-type Ser/Thr phosphatase [Janthinobacterium lividum]